MSFPGDIYFDDEISSIGSLNSRLPARGRRHRRNQLPDDDDEEDGEVIMSPKDSSDRKRKVVNYQTPQEIIDEFWSKFTTKTPGKATTVIPQNPYSARVARKTAKAAISSTTTQASYEAAVAMCRAKVEKIVRECRRVNKKYRDPHFDLETDLKLGRRDCLQSLSNIADANPRAMTSTRGAPSGRDGDCWLMSALCTLSNKKGLIEKLCVAHDQQVGVYGFVFHRDGEWISEIVDDFLYLTKSDYDEKHWERVLFDELERANPEEAYRKVYQSNSTALYFAQCQHPQETWLPLLEKCYAKAHGDYAAIEGGFGGEGIEDLTGGVTSEIFTTDILDKEYFWKEELLKVNQDFLFGCSTGVWGMNWGERKGIVELHSYSIQKAVEIDGKRLLRLKNPWGKGEWKGPWSDGSKEWTPEWLEKLGHRFGDDGDFWIAYEDLLQKYQAFERTRLFGDDWRVSSIWTTANVPWMLEYHDTHFSLVVTRPGPVVIVLAQLDDRYFRGLEGQYRFSLAFRLHKAGHEDYLVRSQAPYRMRRSVNVELDLEEGEYDIRIKIDAIRLEKNVPIEKVIRDNAKEKREKLMRISLAYDLAHSKGKIIETVEEKEARKTHDKRLKDKELQEIKDKLLARRKDDHYLKTKQFEREQKKAQRLRAKAAERRAKHVTASGEEADVERPEAASSSNQVHQPQLSKLQINSNKDYCESLSGDELDSVSPLSEYSDREMDLQAAHVRQQIYRQGPAPKSPIYEDELDEFEKDPWNAVVVIGLRVYHKIADDDEDEVIKLKVERPNPYLEEDDYDYDDSTSDTTSKAGSEPQDDADKSKELDVDDSAKDATLKGAVKDRKKSIMGNAK
ncbi:Calpain-D [Cladobotryum mycophilum]|uniref:Calpain-D n=1 Tax=Cladobotryum mycophilum TaxID=491253 RepID=A0ABR0SRV7_9HYPO